MIKSALFRSKYPALHSRTLLGSEEQCFDRRTDGDNDRRTPEVRLVIFGPMSHPSKKPLETAHEPSL